MGVLLHNKKKGGIEEMVKAKRLNKRLLIFASLALPVIVLTVAAIPTDWFKAAEITGVIVKTESSTVEAIIDLGDLASATPFSVSGDGTITVAESGGLKIEKFVIGFPYYTPEEGHVGEAYITNRFYTLGIDLTVGDITVSMPIVTDGSWDWWYWEFEEDSWMYMRYPEFTTITLPQGTNTATFTIFGTTALRTESLGFEMMCYFTFAPA